MPEEESSAPTIDLNPENYVNDPNIELQWAQKAFQHAEIYFNLLSSIDAKHLKLTRIDDIIYEEFRQAFKDLEVGKLSVDTLKSDSAKEAWRAFCENFRERVEDYNMATLLRLDSSLDYSEENSTIGSGGADDFQARSKNVFETLNGLESVHNAKAKEYIDKSLDFRDPKINDEPPGSSSDNKESQSNRRGDHTHRDSKSTDFEFRVPAVPPLQTRSSPQRRRRQNEPDYVVNPQKWKRYSLEDVKESDMSHSGNFRAAMSFLHRNDPPKTMDEAERAKIEFNRPIGSKKMRIRNRERSEEEESQESEELVEEKTTTEKSSLSAESNGFKRKGSSRRVNLRNKDKEEEDNEESSNRRSNEEDAGLALPSSKQTKKRRHAQDEHEDDEKHEFEGFQEANSSDPNDPDVDDPQY